MHLKVLPEFLRVFLLSILLISSHLTTNAEGTKQLDPNASDMTKLMTNNASYGSFGIYNGGVNTRLYFHVAAPNSETVYLGFSQGSQEFFNASNIHISDTPVDFYFRIKSPDGTVVYGPILVDASTANTNSRALAIAGPAPIVGGGGYTPFTFDPTGLAAGDYYIEFSDNASAVSTQVFDISYFDVTVADGSGAIDGRLWSYNWAFKTSPTADAGSSPYGNFERPFNGELFCYTEDGFVNKINFANSGFRGWFFTVAFNNKGTGNSGDLSEDRRSQLNSYSVLPQHQIFLNDPDPTVYPDGTLGFITAEPQVSICDPSNICITVEATTTGQVELLLDIDQASGAGKYDLNTADVLIIYGIDELPGETAPYRRCVPWDGLDGLGAAVNTGDNVDVYLKLQQGVTHYASFDVEYVVDGYAIDIVRPVASIFVDKLYYDDTNITFLPGNGAAQIDLAGCASPCHAWTNFDYGNFNTINTWWISHTSVLENFHIPWCVPTANPDTAYTAFNQTVLIDVVANDQGTGLYAGSVSVTTLPENGSVSVDPTTGVVTYTPNDGFTGEDFFWYEVCNADAPPLCDDTRVFIFINGLTAINDDNNTLVNQNVNGNVLTNDLDNEGDAITLNLTPYTNPANGGVVLNIDGSYTYTPTADYVGQDQFQYIICDNGNPSACDTATVVITVTDEPSFSNNEVIANADELITNVDAAISANVLANDADVDGDNLTVNTTPLSSPTNGTLTLLANGDFTYTPNSGFAGQDQFEYQVCDDGIPQACAGTIVVIDVIPDLNGSDPNAPFAGDDFNITNLNTNVSGDLSTNDAGGGTINTTPIIDPQHGSVVINPDGTYTYTPTTSYTGPDQFVYQTCNSAGAPVTTTTASSDVPKTIVDLNTISSTLNIASGGTILDINITNLNITHTYIGDVKITLVSPSGTSAVIIANVCGSADNYNVIFDDEGAALSLCTDLVSGGRFKPFNDPLTTFDGENSTGTWTLQINDNASGDAGTLNSWSLEIETSSEVCSQATAYLLVMPPPVTDLDEDNDGIPDTWEAFSGDHDMDGTPDYADPEFCAATFQGVNGWNCANGLPDPDFDLDGDGTPNSVDPDYPYSIPDTDGDGYPDYLDLDADNDGIPDLIEIGGVDTDGNGQVDDNTDSDNDGLVDTYDPDNALNPGVNEGTALLAADTDGDGYPNYIDLDADNDGIPDLIESGGVDADGNGIVDDLSDDDGDGLVNAYDPLNDSNPGSNEGSPQMVTGADSGDGTPTTACTACDFDGDGIPPYLDLDTDNDGILDIVEAGGTDSNNDGQVDDAVGGNGYSNGLDPADGGTPLFTAAVDEGGDANTRPEYTSGSGVGDSDGDDVPDFMDVDSDNDGIYDNYEAQSTMGYTPPEGMDSDGDGIDDAYDADGSASINGLTPYNHDGTDDPDYLDTDADNDNIPDWQEAWDHLYDGDSQPDNITGTTGEDSDGDGLLDVYDSNDADRSVIAWEDDPAEDANGANGAAAGSVFNDNLDVLLPENGGNDLTQPDYRDQLIDCGTPFVYYALTEQGGVTTHFAYNSATGMHEDNVGTGVIRATNFCVRDNWYYFYNPLEPQNYMFAVKYNDSNPGTIPIEDLVNYIELRVDANPAGRQFADGSNVFLVMARDWHVVFKQTPEVGATYDIKFYYNPQDLIDLDIAADALEGSYSGRQLKWFKADQGGDVSFDVGDISAEGIVNMEDITSMAHTVVDENDGIGGTDGSTGVDAGNGKNYVSFVDLPGFSGGTAAISMSAPLPVELSSFKAEVKGCQVDLLWLTQSEKNCSHFELQKSGDGKTFTTITRVEAKGSQESNTYYWTDESNRGTYLYRLKMIDVDGTYSYSSLISAQPDCGDQEQFIELYPNPVQGSTTKLEVYLNKPETNSRLTLTDLLGKTQKVIPVISESSSSRITIDVSDLPEGTYLLLLESNGMKFAKKFVKFD